MNQRRRFLTLACAATPGLFVWGRDTPAASDRTLNLKIAGDFGSAGESDILAVLHSATNELWKHCPNTRFQVRGFHIFHNPNTPITLFDHTADDRIAIGLNAKDTFWSQYAYQYSHEFLHALAGHSNDWRKIDLRGKKPNHWLEESLCEAASLFALRAMAKSWRENPPYPNWRDYSQSLHEYAEERIGTTRIAYPDDDFTAWFRSEQPSLRDHSTQREKNNRIALLLLPLFENHPAGWESLTFANLGPPQPEASLEQHFTRWISHTPATLQPFVRQIARLFQPTGSESMEQPN
jgi:hypothetical protein